jgi:hypothetical protein
LIYAVVSLEMEGRTPRALHVRRIIFLGLKDIVEIHVAQSISLSH